MKIIIIMIAILLSGCAHQGKTDLSKGELFISEDKIHTIKINSHEFYSFKVDFGDTKKRR